MISTRSTLRDADIAEVSSEYIRQQILQQASATFQNLSEFLYLRMQVFFEDKMKNKEELNIYNNEYNDDARAVGESELLPIYDTMNYIKCDVSTICIGMAASMGAGLAGIAQGSANLLIGTSSLTSMV